MQKRYEWKSKIFDMYQDMVLVLGEDWTDEVNSLEYKALCRKYKLQYFDERKFRFFEYSDIVILQSSEVQNVACDDVYLERCLLQGAQYLVDFGNKTRVIYSDGAYETVEADRLYISRVKRLTKEDKSNGTYQTNSLGGENEEYKKYHYDLFPDKPQGEAIDRKIEEYKKKKLSDSNNFSYEPKHTLEDLLIYKNESRYVDIEDIGNVKIRLNDYPSGNCHKICVMKYGETYGVTFYCYKKVVGIDLGRRAVICSTGKKYNLPYIQLENNEDYYLIKDEWKESVALQLLIEYDVLFLEYLKEDADTSAGFKDMIEFSKILKAKAELFNKGNSQKEVFTLSGKFPSTQICHICGYQNIELWKDTSKREWTCPYCGTRHDRDVNAAINILRKGMEEKRQKNI